MKGTIDASARRIFRLLLALCVGLGSYPRLSFAFGGTLSAPEYQAVSDIAGQVIRNAQASSKFVNGIRGLAATVEVAGAARALTANRVTVAVALTAGAALAAYCYTHGAECTKAGSDLSSYWAGAAPTHYDQDSDAWQKQGPDIDGWQWRVNNDPKYSGITLDAACNTWVNWLNANDASFRYVFQSSGAIKGSSHPFTASCTAHEYARSNGKDMGTYTIPATEYATKTPSWLPADLADLQTFVDADPLPDSALNDWPEPLPIPVNAPVVKPSVVSLGDPYAGPDPSTGWRQDYAQVDPKPAPAPWYDVNVTTGTGVVDNPDTTNVEGPKTVDTVDPTTNDQTKPQTTETKDPGLCDMYPGILACQKLGDAPNDQVPKKTVNVEYSPESVDLPVGCPADVPLTHGQVLSYASSCQAASSARPFVLALASISALLMVVAVVRRG